MTEPYDPIAYWTAAGSDRDNPEHESHFVRTDVFARQEETLMGVLEGLTFSSILEAGCGWGRITKLVHDRWPDVPYLATDMSRARLTSAKRKAPGVEFRQLMIHELGTDSPEFRRYDLVLAVETLMHVPTEDIEMAVEKLCDMSAHWVVSLDWSADLGPVPIAPWNARFDYRRLYGRRLVSETPTDLQSIYVADATLTRLDASRSRPDSRPHADSPADRMRSRDTATAESSKTRSES